MYEVLSWRLSMTDTQDAVVDQAFGYSFLAFLDPATKNGKLSYTFKSPNLSDSVINILAKGDSYFTKVLVTRAGRGRLHRTTLSRPCHWANGGKEPHETFVAV